MLVVVRSLEDCVRNYWPFEAFFCVLDKLLALHNTLSFVLINILLFLSDPPQAIHPSNDVARQTDKPHPISFL